MGMDFTPSCGRWWRIPGEIPLSATQYSEWIPSVFKTESLGALDHNGGLLNIDMKGLYPSMRAHQEGGLL